MVISYEFEATWDLRYSAAYIGKFFFLTLEDGTDWLSRNVGKELPRYAAQYLRRAQISSTPQRKPEIAHWSDLKGTVNGLIEGSDLETLRKSCQNILCQGCNSTRVPPTEKWEALQYCLRQLAPFAHELRSTSVNILYCDRKHGVV